MGKGQCIFIPHYCLDRWPVTAVVETFFFFPNLNLMKCKSFTQIILFFKYFLGEINAIALFCLPPTSNICLTVQLLLGKLTIAALSNVKLPILRKT